MNGRLEPEELTRLLRAAVEPVRTSPDAYQRIRAGVERRQWWRIPLMAAGGLVMTALIGLAFVAIRPQSSNQILDPAAPPLISSAVSETGRTSTPTTDGGGGPGSGSGGTGASSPRPTTPSPPATTTTAPVTTSPSAPATTAPTGPGGAGALDLPPPVRTPAGPNDVDGDGVADQVRFVGTKVEVVLSRGGTSGVDLPDLPAPTQHAVVDVNGDGFSEILVRTSSRDGVDDFGMLRYAARGVVAQVAFDTGVRLAAGTHDNAGFGFRCGEGRLEVINGTSTDGSTFQLVTTPLELTVDRLLTGTGTPDQSQLVVTPTNNPFQAACGTFS